MTTTNEVVEFYNKFHEMLGEKYLIHPENIRAFRSLAVQCDRDKTKAIRYYVSKIKKERDLIKWYTDKIDKRQSERGKSPMQEMARKKRIENLNNDLGILTDKLANYALCYDFLNNCTDAVWADIIQHTEYDAKL